MWPRAANGQQPHLLDLLPWAARPEEGHGRAASTGLFIVVSLAACGSLAGSDEQAGSREIPASAGPQAPDCGHVRPWPISSGTVMRSPHITYRSSFTRCVLASFRVLNRPLSIVRLVPSGPAG